MTPRIPNIYILSYYTVSKHATRERRAREEEYKITYLGTNGEKITISETNSLIADKYSMNIHTAKYDLKGGKNIPTKEAMIHNHPKGHKDKHLQFKLHSEHRVIRVFMPLLGEEDYKRCIKGFLYITKEILENEKKEFNIKEDLIKYFFNEKIEEIASEKTFLLKQVKKAFNEEKILNDNEKPITKNELEELKKETQLLPFLKF